MKRIFGFQFMAVINSFENPLFMPHFQLNVVSTGTANGIAEWPYATDIL